MSNIKNIRNIRRTGTPPDSQKTETIVPPPVAVGEGEASEVNWWESRAKAVRAFLAANPLKLGIDTEAATLIQSQLLRGDKAADEATRKRCWKHISIEVDVLHGWDSSKNMPDQTFFKPRELRAMEEPPPIPPTPSKTPTSRPNGIPNGDGDALSGVSVGVEVGVVLPPPSPSVEPPVATPSAASTGGDAFPMGNAPTTNAISEEDEAKNEDQGGGEPGEAPGDVATMPVVKEAGAPTSTPAAPAAAATTTTTVDNKKEGQGEKKMVEGAPDELDEVALAEAALAAASIPPKPVSQMNMMERNAFWSAKKKAALELEKAKKEKEANSHTFKPNTEHSRRTYKAPPRQPRPSTDSNASGSTMASNGSGSGDGNGSGAAGAGVGEAKKAGSSKWGVVKERVRDAKTAGALGSKKSKGSGKGKGTKKDDKDAGVSKEKGALKERPGSGPSRMRLRKDSATASAPVVGLGGGEGEGDENAAPNASLQRSDSAPTCKTTDSTNSEGNGQGEGVEQEGEGGAEPNPAESQAGATVGDGADASTESAANTASSNFVAGEFWWKIEQGRGHHRVREGGDFQMWSIYRKKDKTRGVSGVSMLVGRQEEAPYNEKVLQMMFDTAEWTEERAFTWWQENHDRYEKNDSSNGKLLVSGPGHAVGGTAARVATKPSDLLSARALLSS